jgi:AraC-like DNA-binding protein
MAIMLDGDFFGERLLIVQLHSEYFECSVGREASRAEPVLMPPIGTYQSESANVDIGLVCLDPAMVADYAAGVGGIDADVLRFTGIGSLSPLMARQLQSVMRQVAREVLPNAEVVASSLSCGQTQRLLAASLLATFANTALDALTDSRESVNEPTALRRAVAFINAHAHEDIGITQIAQAGRVGPRGLQQAFRRYRDTTPMQYLRRVRLDRAHRELLAGHPHRGDTVSAIAARWGFAHAGRFSAAYRDAYGYSPSQTLRR